MGFPPKEKENLKIGGNKLKSLPSWCFGMLRKNLVNSTFSAGCLNKGETFVQAAPLAMQMPMTIDNDC